VSKHGKETTHNMQSHRELKAKEQTEIDNGKHKDRNNRTRHNVRNNKEWKINVQKGNDLLSKEQSATGNGRRKDKSSKTRHKDRNSREWTTNAQKGKDSQSKGLNATDSGRHKDRNNHQEQKGQCKRRGKSALMTDRKEWNEALRPKCNDLRACSEVKVEIAKEAEEDKNN
jgi:hypothetical protein